MADNNSYKQTPRRRGPGGGMAPAEKAKNFKGSISKLMQYIGRYKIAILAVMIMAAASTVFTVIGPKVLGKATTGLSEGLMKKITGTGGIDFSYIGRILIIVLCLYACSAIFSFIQGWIMTGVSQKVCYRLRKEISEKINRMPMKYFESRTYGEVLSRITNDVDTLGMGLNQSITTIITSVATMIGVLVMMLSISPLMMGSPGGVARRADGLRHCPGHLGRLVQGGGGAVQIDFRHQNISNTQQGPWPMPFSSKAAVRTAWSPGAAFQARPHPAEIREGRGMMRPGRDSRVNRASAARAWAVS